MRTLPLGVRIVLLVVPLALLPLATVGGVTYYYLEVTVRTETDAAHLRRLGDQTAAFERALTDAQTVAHVLANLPQVTRLASSPAASTDEIAQAQRVIDVGMQLSGVVSRVALARGDGPPVVSAVPPGQAAADPAAALALLTSTGRPLRDDDRFLVSAGDTIPSVGVIHTVGSRPGDPVIVVLVDLGALVRELEPSAGGATACLLILDGDGVIAARSGPAPEHVPAAVLQAAARRAVASPQALGGVDVAGHDVFVASSSPMADARHPALHTRPLYLVFLAQQLPMAARLNELRRMALFLAGVSLAFGLIGAGLLARSVVHPIDALLDMTTLIGEGQFDVRLEKVRDDEIGQLVEAFNTMATSIADYRDKLVRAETFAALGRVASTVAHEVRNPLNAMRGCIEYLRLKRPDDAVVQHHAGMIGEEITQLESFVSDFLRVTRIERPRLAPTDLADLLRARVALHEAAAIERGVRIALAPPHDPLLVIADPQQIGIVIENLINNAIDAMPEGGDLSIRAEAAGATATVTVSDTGNGITPDVQKNLFTPFFSTKAEGAGIGLAISRRIIEAHGGRLDFSSTPGSGTTFRAEFPIVPIGNGEISPA
jgi:signal transduction histidine kinase